MSFSQYDDVIDVRDIIARVEELEDSRDDESADPDELQELETLSGFLDDIKGYGGDEQWRGDWYPVALIRDSYFTEYAQELADDIGAIDRNARWPLTCIDWNQAARELQIDYSSAEFCGVTYWFR